MNHYQKRMKIFVIGSGGREHAICWKLAQSRRVSKIFCADGNAGIAQIAECVAIKPDRTQALVDFAVENAIDLTFVGGETPLALGIVDEFEKRGLKIIGAGKAAARLEASKSFAKDFMTRHLIPTAKYKTANSTAEAIDILRSGEMGEENSPVVVKADGLAAGKGVVVARDRSEGIAAINDLENVVGKGAVEKIVLEECLLGREVSLLMFADGEDFALMPPVRDHKRIGEGDTGPNTGGMGTVTDSSLLTEEQTLQIIEEIIKPTLRGCIKEGFPFRGVLFLGLMLSEPPALAGGQSPRLNDDDLKAGATPPAHAGGSDIKVLEYNVRFGDPETQAILVRLETDLIDICEAMFAGKLSDLNIEWRKGSSACIVLASEGYPQKPRTGNVIHGLEKAEGMGNVTIFHAGSGFAKTGINASVNERAIPQKEGTILNCRISASYDRTFITSGGRVLGITATGENLRTALSRAYDAVSDISWDGMQYRRDIGKSRARSKTQQTRPDNS